MLASTPRSCPNLASAPTRALLCCFHIASTRSNNGNGKIEMDEYFIWTLDVASKQGCGLETIFKKYDTSGEGMLDANEFSLAVEDLGFSATFAHDLFVELDDDNSGAVSYTELTATLKSRIGSVRDVCPPLPAPLPLTPTPRALTAPLPQPESAAVLAGPAHRTSNPFSIPRHRRAAGHEKVSDDARLPRRALLEPVAASLR